MRFRWILVTAGLLATPAAAETIVGQAEVVDGDTLRIGTERIRLLGIDAPEATQTCVRVGGGEWPCGEVATAALRTFAALGTATCVWDGRDQYDRLLAICVAGDGTPINATMVKAGLAWAYRSTAYDAEEEAARAAARGVWQATTITAAEYRRATDAAIVANQPRPPGDCLIKGNINANGERIYHLPGADGYEETVIRTEQGERWFCTEDAAVAAGWRARQ